MPGFRHALKSAAAEAVGIYRHPTPAEDTQAFLVGGGLDGDFCVAYGIRREKSEAQTKLFRKIDSLLAGLRSEEVFRKCGEKPGTVAARSIGIYAAAMGKAFEGGQRVVNNVVPGRSAEAGDKAGTAGVMIRMAPVGVHTGAGLPLALVGWQSHVCL